MIDQKDLEAARDAVCAGRPALLRARTPSDTETPVSVFLKLGRDRINGFLLESVEGGELRGRYSIIGLDPDLAWRVVNGRAECARGPEAVAAAAFEPDDNAPLTSLRNLIGESALELPPDAPPPAAGLFGYLGFETIGFVERLTFPDADPVGTPTAWLVRPSVILVFDSLRQELSAFAPVRPSEGTPSHDEAQALIAAAAERITSTLAALRRPLASLNVATDLTAIAHPEPKATPVAAAEAYRSAVSKAKDYIHAGDVFQVVPSQRFTAQLAASPFALYRALRRLNPSPFLFYFNFGPFCLVGSSPEILVRVRGRTMTVRPIAGTRPRGATPEEDAQLATDLLADPKERAEHLMLLDLGRNDVGRVSRAGTVSVETSFDVQRYSHVMHLESQVTGVLRDECDALDAVLAGFPAGTVSGAPKVRAMEIIAELEGERRGVYAGGVGYVSAAGDIDTCIALRTAVVKDGVMHVRAGAGVVADSDPETERLETEHKAAALFRAAAQAPAFE